MLSRLKLFNGILQCWGSGSIGSACLWTSQISGSEPISQRYGSASGAGFGSISQRYGSRDPVPHQNITGLQHWSSISPQKLTCYSSYLINSWTNRLYLTVWRDDHDVRVWREDINKGGEIGVSHLKHMLLIGRAAWDVFLYYFIFTTMKKLVKILCACSS
jgi:hypothetical protein